MKTRMTLLFIVLAAGLLSGCAVGLHAQHLRTANFAAYDTFYWLPVHTPEPLANAFIDSAVIDSGIVTKRVRGAVVATLTGHGYARVDGRQAADFVVSYGVSTDKEVRGMTYGAGFGFATYPFYPGVYYPEFYFPFYPGYTTFETYTQAHLIINVWDAHTHQLVWRGWNTMRLTAENFSRESVSDIVHTILSRFPPEASVAA